MKQIQEKVHAGGREPIWRYHSSCFCCCPQFSHFRSSLIDLFVGDEDGVIFISCLYHMCYSIQSIPCFVVIVWIVE